MMAGPRHAAVVTPPARFLQIVEIHVEVINPGDGPPTHDVPAEAMLLRPGVIHSTTDFAEHPQMVADRICQEGRGDLATARLWGGR